MLPFDTITNIEIDYPLTLKQEMGTAGETQGIQGEAIAD